MDVSVDNEVIVNTNGTVEVAVGNAADAVVADDHALDITVTKKEYKIVGDEVYIAKLYDDAPQWMRDLVQLVVDNTLATESSVLLGNLVSQLNQFATSYVPLNTYTQSILDLSNADTAMHATLETLNSNFNDGLNEANSQIIDLQLTKASKTEVTTKVIETLAAQLATPTSELGATIGNLQQAIVNGDSANADSVTTLMSVLEGEVDARATAVEYLNTYVGIDSSGNSTGTGILNSISELQNQIDGNITTWFYNGVPTTATMPASAWLTNEEKANHVGDIYYDKASGYGYRFAYEDIVDDPDMGIVYSWIQIIDTDVVKALADAANAQATADGKIVTFYQASVPIAEGVGDIWIDSDNGNKMYRWNGSTWGSDLVGTMVANASAVTSLSTELSNGTTTWAAADSTVVNSLNTAISNGDAAVEAKWAYNSALTINGTTYNSGFGLSNSAGTGIGSEFWVDASRFKFTNSAATGSTAPFTIDASGATPQITFNGKVSFSNVTDVPQLGSTPQEVVTAINAGNTTTINGGKITTGSITANQIAANTISTNQIAIGTGIVNGYVQSSDFSAIGGPGFRLKSNAAGTSADPSIYGAYIKGGVLDGATLTGQLLDISNLKVSNGSANTADFNISLSTYTANSGLRLYGKNYSAGYIPQRLVSNIQKIHVQAGASYSYGTGNQSTSVTVKYSLNGGAWIDITSQTISGTVMTSTVQVTAVGSLAIDPTTFNTLDVMFVPSGSGQAAGYKGGYLSVSTTNL